MLGLPGGSAAAELYDRWDKDGSGSIELRELNSVLRRGIEMSAELGPKSDYAINLTARRNWSRRKVDGASGIVLHVHSDSTLMRGALKQRPAAPPQHEAWRQAGPLLSSGGVPMPGSPPPLSPGRAQPWRMQPPRSPDQVVADLVAKQTEATRMRASQNGGPAQAGRRRARRERGRIVAAHRRRRARRRLPASCRVFLDRSRRRARPITPSPCRGSSRPGRGAAAPGGTLHAAAGGVRCADDEPGEQRRRARSAARSTSHRAPLFW